MRSLSRRGLLASGAAVLVSCTSRGGRAAPNVARVVSTAPSMTEIVFALGRGEALVGRSRFCDYPPEAERVPVIGGFADPSVEKIVALEPSLVCGERGPAGPELPRRLESLDIATYFPEMDSIASIGAAFVGLGRRIDAEDKGKELERELRASIAETEKKVASRPCPRALFLFDWKPIVVAGPGSFPDELLRIAGAVNAMKEGDKYPKLGPEAFFALDPDVIVDGSGHGDVKTAAGSIPGLDSLRAVKEGRLHALASAAALRPGPRIGAGIAELARFFHESVPR